jgi:hypothetical protein
MFFALLSSMVIWKMVADVNSRVEESERFSYLWWYFGKLDRLWRTHRSFFPHSPWRKYLVVILLLTGLSIWLAGSQFVSGNGQ